LIRGRNIGQTAGTTTMMCISTTTRMAITCTTPDIHGIESQSFSTCT